MNSSSSNAKPTLAERLNVALATVFGGTARWAFVHPWRALLLCLVITAPFAWYARTVRVDAHASALLPKDFESVQTLDDVKRHFGGTGSLVLVFENAEPESLRKLADAMAPKLAALPEVRWVDYRQPKTFFKDRALYFLPTEKLRELTDKVSKRYQWEVWQKSPFALDFGDAPEQPPPLDLKGLAWSVRNDTGMAWNGNATSDDEYYLDKSGRRLVIMVRPTFSATDMAASSRLRTAAEDLLVKTDLRPFGDQIRFQLGGSVAANVEQAELAQRDLKVITGLSLIACLGFLAWHFRRFYALVLLFGPLTVALLWALGFAGMAFGQLNILTSMLGALLTGMGIENGIHLLARVEADWKEGNDVPTLVHESFGATGVGIVAAVGTNIAAFAAIGMSHFRAFHELGVVAAVGLGLAVVAYLLLLPPLLRVALSRGWRPRNIEGLARTRSSWIVRHAGKLLTAGTLVVGASLVFVPSARFNSDYRAILPTQLPAFQLDEVINTALGHQSQPVLVITPNLETEQATSQTLRDGMRSRGTDSTIQFVVSSSDLVPTDQEAKAPLIKKLKRMASRLDPQSLPAEDRERFDQFRKMTEAQPFGRSDLPPEVMRQFTTLSGEDVGVVLVYPSVYAADGAELQRFASELRAARLPDGTALRPAGDHMIAADTYALMSKEAAPVMGMATGVILLMTAIMLLSLRLAGVTVVPVIMGMVATLAYVGLTPLDFNYLNIIVVPVLVATSVDGSIHLLQRVREGDSVATATASTGRAVFACVMTNMLGFGSLVLADHAGIRSIGHLSLAGFGLGLLVTLVFFPALLETVQDRLHLNLAKVMED